MKAKRFKIKIQTFEQAGHDFVKAWKLAEKGKQYEPGYDLVIGLPDAASLLKILSPERVRIIQTIREKKPSSIRQLAKLLGRAQSNVQRDVQELAQFGVIELKKKRNKGGQKEALEQQYNWDGFDIAV